MLNGFDDGGGLGSLLLEADAFATPVADFGRYADGLDLT
jgi:hypothetical protein